MKKNFLRMMLLTLSAMLGLSVQAGDWEVPQMPTSVAPTNGAMVMLYNVGNEMCMGNGKISAAWATSTILVENNPLTFELVENNDGTWSLRTASGEKKGQWTFAPFAEGDRPYCFIDMGWEDQGCRRWYVEETEQGYYTLELTDKSLADEGTYLGTNGETLDVVCNADPEVGGMVEWMFLPGDALKIYEARCQLYEQLEMGENYKNLDLSEYTALYNNPEATAEELLKAVQLLKAAIVEAEINGGYDPSPEDPLDVTDSFIENPSFDTDVHGWDNLNGMTHDPNGTQYGDVHNFCEKWANAQPLGKEYGISQTVTLPAGRYLMEADVIASAQYAGDISVKGVKLYVKNNGVEYNVACATANNSPVHYVIDFIAVEGEPTELGFHVDANTEANWVAVDNFALYYLGKSEMSAAYLKLQNTLKAALETYPEDEYDDLMANAIVKNDFTAAVIKAQEVAANATASDEDCQAAQEALAEAQAALKASLADYKALNALYNNFELLTEIYDLEVEVIDEMIDVVVTHALDLSSYIEDMTAGPEELVHYTEIYNLYNGLYKVLQYCTERQYAAEDNGYADLVEMIQAKANEIAAGWVAQMYGQEDVARLQTEVEDIVAAYMNATIVPNSDLTAMLINPNFDDNANGWNTNGYPNPKWADHVAEYFQQSFNLSQTLKKLPRGRYTLTCRGFQRRGTINAYLYANNEQVLLHNVRDFAAEPGFYSDGENYPYDSYTEGVGYYPNSTIGAYTWFNAEVEEPMYVNKLDFFLTEADQNDVIIGVRSDDNGDWCLFDDFQLYYHGNNAADYADALNELMAQLDEKMEDGYPTAALKKDATAAKAAAKQAIETSNADDCIAAITVLKETIAQAEVTLALTQQIVEKQALMAEYRVEKLVSSTKDEYMNYLDGLTTALLDATIKDDAEAQEILDAIDVKFTQCVQHDGLDATEEKPFDMTDAILNPNYEYDFASDLYDGNEFNAYGWDGDQPNCNEYSAEFFNITWSKGIDIHQTIKGLAPGYYKLRVQGYNRTGYGNEQDESIATYSVLYANEFETRLCDVLDYKQEERLCDPNEEGMSESQLEIDEETTYYYPGNMPQSFVYFEEGYYKNMLIFKVDEGQQEVTFGIRKTTFYDWDSVMFDNWMLEFVGQNEPTEEQTAIENVALDEVTGTRIYSLDGMELGRLQKGVNILKQTDKNGRVRVTKVMVK